MKPFVRSLIASSMGLSTALAGAAASAEPGSSVSPLMPQQQGVPGAVPPSQAPTEQAPTQQAPSAAPGSVSAIIDAALGQLQLDEQQQQAIQKLRSSVAEKEDAIATAGRQLMSTLASALEAGKVDRSALEPDVDAFVKATESASPALRGALVELHNILTPAQRSQFVDALQAGMQQAGGKQPAAQSLAGWAKELSLTDPQKSQIKDLVDRYEPDANKSRQNLEKVLEAFKSDTFSIDQIMPARDVSARAHGMVEHLIDMTDTLARILTPDQRTRLVERIRQSDRGNAGKPGAAPQQPGQQGGMAPGARQLPATPGIGQTQSPLWGARAFGYPGTAFAYPGYGYTYGYPGYAAPYGFGYATPYGYDTGYSYGVPYGYGYATPFGYGYSTGYRSGYGYSTSSGYPFGGYGFVW